MSADPVISKRSSQEKTHIVKRLRAKPAADADHVVCKICLVSKPIGEMNCTNNSSSYCLICTPFYKHMSTMLGQGRLPRQINLADLVRHAHRETQGRAELLIYSDEHPIPIPDARPGSGAEYSQFYQVMARRLGPGRLPTLIEFQPLVDAAWKATGGKVDELVYFQQKSTKAAPAPAPGPAPAPDPAPAQVPVPEMSLLAALQSQAHGLELLDQWLSEPTLIAGPPLLCGSCYRLSNRAEFYLNFATMDTCLACRQAQIDHWVAEAQAIAHSHGQRCNVDAAAVVDLLRAQRGLCPRSRVPIAFHNRRFGAMMYCVGFNYLVGNWQLICPAAIELL